jgi:hypothetical protein
MKYGGFLPIRGIRAQVHTPLPKLLSGTAIFDVPPPDFSFSVMPVRQSFSATADLLLVRPVISLGRDAPANPASTLNDRYRTPWRNWLYGERRCLPYCKAIRQLAANQRRLPTSWFGTVINDSEVKLAL